MSEVIALFALGVSLLSLFYSRFDKRPRLRVSVSTAELEAEEDPEWGPELPEEIFFLDISNTGQTRIKVMSHALSWGKMILHYPDFQAHHKREAPFWLVPGDSIYFGTPTDELQGWLYSQGARGSVRLRGIVWVALGKRHRSRPIRLEIPAPRRLGAKPADED